MLRDTSIASAIVMYCDGSVTVAEGRASGDDGRMTRPSSTSAGGTWRRMRWPAPIESRTSGQARIADGRVLAPPAASSTYAAISAGTSKQEPEHFRPQEPHRRPISSVEPFGEPRDQAQRTGARRITLAPHAARKCGEPMGSGARQTVRNRVTHIGSESFGPAMRDCRESGTSPARRAARPADGARPRTAPVLLFPGHEGACPWSFDEEARALQQRQSGPQGGTRGFDPCPAPRRPLHARPLRPRASTAAPTGATPRRRPAAGRAGFLQAPRSRLVFVLGVAFALGLLAARDAMRPAPRRTDAGRHRQCRAVHDGEQDAAVARRQGRRDGDELGGARRAATTSSTNPAATSRCRAWARAS